jgi:hypothetical protein
MTSDADGHWVTRRTGGRREERGVDGGIEYGEPAGGGRGEAFRA